jgi:hypothetical protein
MEFFCCDLVRHISSFLPSSSKICLRHTSTKFICVGLGNDPNLGVMEDAITYDNPKLLEYLHLVGYKITKDLFAFCITNNAFKNIKWYLEHPLNYFSFFDKSGFMNVSAKANNLNILKYLIEVWGSDQLMSNDILESAIVNKNEEMINTILGYCGHLSPILIIDAIRSQSISIIEKIWNLLPLKNEDNCMNIACETGNIDVVEFLLQKKCRFTDNSCTWAARSGNLEFLKLISRQHEVPIYLFEIFDVALEYGYIDILNWILPNYGIPTNVIHRVIIYSRGGKTVTVLQWLLNNDYLFTDADIIKLKTIGDDDVDAFLQSL